MRLKALASATLLTVSAGVTAQDVFPLFGGGDLEVLTFGQLDADPASPGREALIGNDGFQTVIDGEGNARTKWKIAIKVRTPDGGSSLGRFNRNLSVTTNAYPDPGNPDNQDSNQGNTNAKCYSEEDTDWFYCPFNGESEAREIVSEDILDDNFGIGVAAGAQGDNYIVAGLSLTGEWFSQNSNNDGDISGFIFYSFDTGTWRYNCDLELPLFDNGGYELDYEYAVVGDFLAANGRDGLSEIRLESYNDDTNRVKLRFYDPADCSRLSTEIVTAPTVNFGTGGIGGPPPQGF